MNKKARLALAFFFRPGVKIRDCKISIGESSGSVVEQGKDITEKISLILPCLYVGYTIWTASLPEIGQRVSQTVAGVDVGGVREQWFESGGKCIHGGIGRDKGIKMK